MNTTFTGDFIRKSLTVILVAAILGTLIIAFGCAPTAQQTGPKINPERQKAIQDSLQKVYEFEMRKHYSTAWEYYKNKMYRNSIKPFWKVIEIDTIQYFKDTYTYLQDAYIKLNNPDSAQIVLEMGVKQYPKNAYLHRNLAWFLAGRGMTDQAIREYEIATGLDPDQINDWKQLATLYIKNDMQDESITAYEKVLELDPKDQDAQRALSQLYSSIDPMKAIENMEKMKESDPENTQNLYNLARAYYRMEDFDNAIINFDLLLKLKPQDISALELLGTSLQNKGNLNRAINVYKEVMNLQPENNKILTDIAECYKDLGNFQTGRTYALRALKIDPKFGNAYIVIGDIYEAQATKCYTDRGKTSPEYDDKLIFQLAVDQYKNAEKDLQFKETARSKIKYLEPFLPTKEDKFFYKHTKAKLDCYQWIYR